MSALVQANILEFIEQRGKAALPDIYGQFELVGKRVVDDALLALQERRELIRGGDSRQIVYAPARARRNGGDGEPDYTVIRAKAQELMALSPKHQVRRVDLVKALPGIDAKAIDAWIYQEGRAGRLVRVQLGVYRNGAPPPVTTRDRLEAVFREKKRRTRAEVYAELSDLNLHSVSTTLSEVIAQGRVRAMDNMLTWVGEPLTKPGVIKRGGGRKPSNIDLVQRALKDGPKQRDYLLAVINGPKPDLTLSELVEFGVITYDEFTGGYRLPGTHTRSDDTVRDASAEATAEEPEAVATPTRAGDAPAESATEETPEPAMGPAPATVKKSLPVQPDAQRDTKMAFFDPALYATTPVDGNGVPAATPQPPPADGQDLVLLMVVKDVIDSSGSQTAFRMTRDLMARAEMGRAKYGVMLHTCNGRDALMDAYQEALDLVMYMRQKLAEKPSLRLQAEYLKAIELAQFLSDQLAARDQQSA